MTRWLQRLGKIARIAALCGTVAWLVLLTSSPQEPDAAHPQRYSHRHDVRYVSQEMGSTLRILLGSTFALVLVAFGCHFAPRDMRDGT
ncbi:hypothetical protein ABIB81_002133 [Bradyrhizobium sp. I1.7.5]